MSSVNVHKMMCRCCHTDRTVELASEAAVAELMTPATVLAVRGVTCVRSVH